TFHHQRIQRRFCLPGTAVPQPPRHLLILRAKSLPWASLLPRRERPVNRCLFGRAQLCRVPSQGTFPGEPLQCVWAGEELDMRFEVSRVLDAIERRLSIDPVLAGAILDVEEVLRAAELDGGRPAYLPRVGTVIDALS